MNPELLEVQLTPDCNLSCVYCGNDPKLRTEPIISKKLIMKAIDELSPKKIDESIYNLKCEPVPSYVNFQCTELYYSFVIDNFGYIRVCPGIWKTIGNIREKKLYELWSNKYLVNLRGNLNNLSGKCGNCSMREQEKRSYGCRAYSYLNNEDIFGEYSE